MNAVRRAVTNAIGWSLNWCLTLSTVPGEVRAAPPNDLCMNADGLGSNLQNGTTLGAFHDGDATCDAGGVASRDVWYALVPDFPYTVFLEVKSTAFDPVVAIYDIF